MINLIFPLSGMLNENFGPGIGPPGLELTAQAAECTITYRQMLYKISISKMALANDPGPGHNAAGNSATVCLLFTGSSYLFVAAGVSCCEKLRFFPLCVTN